MVQLELAKWLNRETGEDKAAQVTAFTEMCVVVPLDTKIARAAAGFVHPAQARHGGRDRLRDSPAA